MYSISIRFGIYFIMGVIALFPASLAFAATDYFLKIDGIKGESVDTREVDAAVRVAAPAGVPAVIDASITTSDKPSESAATGVEPDEIDVRVQLDANQMAGVEREEIGVRTDTPDTSEKKSGGKVEATWKVEEGENAVVMDSNELRAKEERRATNFGILLSGGGDTEGVEGGDHRSEMAKIVLAAAQESNMPMESISLNYQKMDVVWNKEVRLFGFVPVTVPAHVEVDSQVQVKVRFPWWTLFASGKNSDAFGQSVADAIADIVESRHDTLMSVIQNIR